MIEAMATELLAARQALSDQMPKGVDRILRAWDAGREVGSTAMREAVEKMLREWQADMSAKGLVSEHNQAIVLLERVATLPASPSPGTATAGASEPVVWITPEALADIKASHPAVAGAVGEFRADGHHEGFTVPLYASESRVERLETAWIEWTPFKLLDLGDDELIDVRTVGGDLYPHQPYFNHKTNSSGIIAWRRSVGDRS